MHLLNLPNHWREPVGEGFEQPKTSMAQFCIGCYMHLISASKTREENEQNIRFPLASIKRQAIITAGNPSPTCNVVLQRNAVNITYQRIPCETQTKAMVQGDVTSNTLVVTQTQTL